MQRRVVITGAPKANQNGIARHIFGILYWLGVKTLVLRNEAIKKVISEVFDINNRSDYLLKKNIILPNIEAILKDQVSQEKIQGDNVFAIIANPLMSIDFKDLLQNNTKFDDDFWNLIDKYRKESLEIEKKSDLIIFVRFSKELSSFEPQKINWCLEIEKKLEYFLKNQNIEYIDISHEKEIGDTRRLTFLTICNKFPEINELKVNDKIKKSLKALNKEEQGRSPTNEYNKNRGKDKWNNKKWKNR